MINIRDFRILMSLALRAPLFPAEKSWLEAQSYIVEEAYKKALQNAEDKGKQGAEELGNAEKSAEAPIDPA